MAALGECAYNRAGGNIYTRANSRTRGSRAERGESLSAMGLARCVLVRACATYFSLFPHGALCRRGRVLVCVAASKQLFLIRTLLAVFLDWDRV